MQTSKTPKLPLSDRERTSLRQAKIRLHEIADMEPAELSRVMDAAPDRAKRLIALAIFQQIPSVGPRMAQDVVDLGYFSLDDLQDIEGAELLNRLEKLRGCWQDPCVEDVLRLIVYTANHRRFDKQWWDFTEERKAYRNKMGYPADRPAVSWQANR